MIPVLVFLLFLLNLIYILHFLFLLTYELLTSKFFVL